MSGFRNVGFTSWPHAKGLPGPSSSVWPWDTEARLEGTLEWCFLRSSWPVSQCWDIAEVAMSSPGYQFSSAASFFSFLLWG